MAKNNDFENITIVTALIKIIKKVKYSNLSCKFWKQCEPHFAYLRSQLGLSDMQIVFISVLLENDHSQDLCDIANRLEITYFEMQAYANEMDELVNNKWVIKEKNQYTENSEFRIAPEAMTALRNNQVFIPEEPEVEDESTDSNENNENNETNINNDTENPNDDSNSKRESFLYDFISHTEINVKPLFYNPAEETQLKRLSKILMPENFHTVQQRLEAQKMRKGFACLFHGGPGTGKTETVYQLACQTGRDIMMVDIATMRSKYIGDSQKNIKRVFNRYRSLCQESEETPILFINEADGIFSKRSMNIEHNCDKEENAMQNAILQEMEDLEGILIATTNLTCNLDKAFERRFLYKIEFTKPSVEVKAKIWRSMMEGLSKKEALHLAANYDFSGGQIENVARKRTIDNIIYGKRISLEAIEEYCRAEILDNIVVKPIIKKERHHIAGFRTCA